MGARRERGVFKFQLECFQDSADGREEWCIATKEYRSMTRWSADCPGPLRSITPPNNAELSRCLQLFVQQGLTSPYNTNPMAHLIAAPKLTSAPRVYPVRSPKTPKGLRVDSVINKSPSLKIPTRYTPNSAPLPEASLKPPTVNKDLRAKISPKPVSISSRLVRKKPQAIAITSSDDGSNSSASDSGRELRPKCSIPLESARALSLKCPELPSTCPERSDVFEASNESGGHNLQVTLPTRAAIAPETSRNSAQPDGAAEDYSGAASDSSLDYPRSDSPIVLIDSGPEIGRVLYSEETIKGKRLSPIVQPSLSRPDKKARPTTFTPQNSFQGVLCNNLVGQKAAAGEVFSSPKLNPIYLDEARPYKRSDLPGGVIFSEDDDVLFENGTVKPEYRARLSPMFAKHAIIIPPSCSGALDDYGSFVLALAQRHANDLFCLVRRRKITYDLFSQVILLHHASEAFYLALNLISARVLQNVHRRLKPPSMRDKNVEVFPGCAECSNFIAVINQHNSDRAYCLFCDMPCPIIDRVKGVQFSSILQPNLPKGGYRPTEADLIIASQWLSFASRNPGPILSFIFSVFAMIPPGWGVHMLRLIQNNNSDLKLCGHCGLGSIIGHSWHDCSRCTWCMGKRSIHRRNLENPDGLRYHLDHAIKLHKAVESESSFLPPITKANITAEDGNSDSSPYNTENIVIMNQSSGSNPSVCSENIRPQEPILITGINSMPNVIYDDAPSTACAGTPQACEVIINYTADVERELTMLQRIDATSPASTSPQTTTACFPIIDPAEFMATEITAVFTTDADEARINAALAQSQKLSTPPGELELDYNPSEE